MCITDCMSYYVIHYQNGDGIVVQADGRNEARSIGENALDLSVSAAVREDEGALIKEEEKHIASTQKNPYRFIEES